MKRLFILLIFFTSSILFCSAQKSKIYLKKYITAGISVEIWGYDQDKAFIPDGSVVTYYGNKQKALEGKYRQGIPNGEWKLYYENGKLKATAAYIQGELSGKMKTYFDNGVVASVLTYNEGALDGDIVYYNPDNTKRYEITYRKNRLTSIQTYKNNKTFQSIQLATNLDIQSHYIPSKNKYPFEKICFYNSDKLNCLTIQEFAENLLIKGLAADLIVDIMTGFEKLWKDLGLKGNVLTQCANGFLGVSDIGNPATSGIRQHTGIPGIDDKGNSAFKDKVDDACSRAMGTGKVPGSDEFTGNGPLIGPGSNSLSQNLIDRAVAAMDKMATNCKDNGNSMIALVPLLANPWVQRLIWTALGYAANEGYKYYKGEHVMHNPTDVYKHEDGVYTVKEQDGEYEVTRNNDGSTTVQVIYDGEYEGYVDPIRTRQTCIVANESVQGCTVEVYTTELGWKDINDMSVGLPKNAKSNTQIKQAATDANCAASGNSSEKCNENAAHHPNTVQQTGAKGQYYENSGSNCEQIKSWWARFKQQCEDAHWQTKACIEMVYFMNGCPIDITVVDPTPEGGMYFGCGGTGDAEVLKKACDRKTWVQNSLPDGPVSQAECLNPSDITKISIGFDPCGPEVQPTEEMGCHPLTNVPSETGTRPTPQGNPIAAPLFINNKFKTFSEYVQHNQYMHSISLPNNPISFATSKKISSKNSFQQLVSKVNPTVVVFYSNKCTPSLNYLSAIQNKIEKIENNAEVYVVDVEQNPELINDYNIQFTPTTIIFKNGKAIKIFSGAGKVDELLSLK